MKRIHWVGSILATVLVGCTAMGPVAVQHVPKGAEVVGGGLSVDWDAPRDGTAVLIEVTSGKVIRTESLRTGDRFSFNGTNEDSAAILNTLFEDAHVGSQSTSLLSLPGDARFVLYFAANK